MNCINCGTPITDLTKPCPGCGKVFSSKERQLYLISKQQGNTAAQVPVAGAPAAQAPAPAPDANSDPTQVFTPPVASTTPTAPAAPQNAAQAPAAPWQGQQQPQQTGARSGKFTFDARAAQPVAPEQSYGGGYQDQGAYAPGPYVNDQPQDVPQDQPQTYDYEAKTRHTGRNIVIALLIIAVLGVCAVALWQIGKKLGFIGGGANGGAEVTSTDSIGAENITGAAIGDTAQLGQYTVSSSEKNIIMYQIDDGQRIIASIPSNTIITVSEISNGYAKTTYKNYTGWVSLDDITYTPGANGGAQQADADAGDHENSMGYRSGTYEVVDAYSVNVRSAPDSSDDDNIVGTAHEGEQYSVNVFDGMWANITLDDGTSGWIYMGYMDLVGDDDEDDGDRGYGDDDEDEDEDDDDNMVG